MERSCRFRCRCFVTPGAVSCCKANCRTGDCTAWTVHDSSLKQVIHRWSATIFHFRSVYCSSLLYFACVFLLFATFFSWVLLFYFYYFRCLPFSNLSLTLTAIISVECQCTTGCQFRAECRSYQARSFGGPWFRFRSLWYPKHTAHIWVQFHFYKPIFHDFLSSCTLLFPFVLLSSRVTEEYFYLLGLWPSRSSVISSLDCLAPRASLYLIPHTNRGFNVLTHFPWVTSLGRGFTVEQAFLIPGFSPVQYQGVTRS